MAQGWIGVLGGIGLFLFGMGVVTAALADLAGPKLRRLLGRATATPLRGALTGAVAATALQSTTAVLVMTIGFVGAGAMSFPQTIGVIAGASLGSTVGGWAITLMGLKFGLGTAAMPVLAAAALVALVARGRGAGVARLIAGLSLLFIGLQEMQSALSGGGVLAADLPQATGLAGGLLLLLVGAGVAMVIQSSNTGLALVMAMLGAGTLVLDQAAILVVGLNIGGPAAWFLAAAGGGRDGRLTALASVVMHGATGLLLFAAVPLLLLLPAEMDAQVALVLWDTVFNFAMAALFLPWPHHFAASLQRLVPDRGRKTLLDPGLLADPGTALSVALETAADLRRSLAAEMAARLDGTGAQAVQPGARQALEDWLGQIRIPQGGDGLRQCRTALFHLTDHLARLQARLAETDRLDLIRRDPGLSRIARILVRGLTTGRSRAGTEQAVIDRAHRLRHETLESETAGNLPADQVFSRTDALRWLERVADHAARIALHEAEARRALNG